jgi:hypothetical protein
MVGRVDKTYIGVGFESATVDSECDLCMPWICTCVMLDYTFAQIGELNSRNRLAGIEGQ